MSEGFKAFAQPYDSDSEYALNLYRRGRPPRRPRRPCAAGDLGVRAVRFPATCLPVTSAKSFLLISIWAGSPSLRPAIGRRGLREVSVDTRTLSHVKTQP